MTDRAARRSEGNPLPYGLFDADQHYYEPEDALTRHLAPEFRRAVRWIEMDGHRTLMINGKLVTVVPNPTYDPVGVPGTLETYFRSANHDGLEMRDMIEMQPIQPEYRDRDLRIAKLDEQGVDFAWLIPSLGLGLEEMVADRPPLVNALFEAYNRWLDDDWGYDRDGRIQTGPLISLIDPEAAEAELDRVLRLGARMICLRPGPVAAPGLPRSIGDVRHDGVWARCAEAGVIVSFHAADSGYGKYLKDWGMHDGHINSKLSTFEEVLSTHIEKPIFDTMAAIVCHGVLDRHPTLKLATLELGAAWVPDLMRRLKAAYGKTPQHFEHDPIEQFREQVWVTPFYEDDLGISLDAIGPDHLMLGSDWPHPEGLATPADAIRDFEVLGDEMLRKAMRDNLAHLVGHPRTA